MAPMIVVTTIAVLVSGVVLLFGGPALRDPLVLIHKVAFIVWVALTALHILAHLPGLAAAWDRWTPINLACSAEASVAPAA
jgi:hypothetical protein